LRPSCVRGKLAVLALLLAAPTARGSPYLQCGGEKTPGTREVVREADDNCGNTFKLICVDNNYLEGEIFNESKDKTYAFGKCTYDGGVNQHIFTFDADGCFTRIVHFNIDPNPKTQAEVDLLGVLLAQDPSESTREQESRDLNFLILGGFSFHYFVEDFSDQSIQDYDHGVLSRSVNLTIDEAAAAYANGTGLDFLQPDPRLVTPPYGGPVRIQLGARAVLRDAAGAWGRGRRWRCCVGSASRASMTSTERIPPCGFSPNGGITPPPGARLAARARALPLAARASRTGARGPAPAPP